METKPEETELSLQCVIDAAAKTQGLSAGKRNGVYVLKRHSMAPMRQDAADATHDGDEENEKSDAGEQEDVESEAEGAELACVHYLRRCGGACCLRLENCRLRARYSFDQWITSRINQFKLILYLTFLAVFFEGILFRGVDDTENDPRWAGDEREGSYRDFMESVWEVYMFTVDPGYQGEMVAWSQRIVAIICSSVGIVIFSIVIGFIVDAITEKMENLKKGKSMVVEAEHTLMLRWTDKSANFCREIADANSSEGGGVIVVLDERDKEELEMMCRNQIAKSEMIVEGQRTRIVFRSGSPLRATDLERVSAHTARSIVILSDYEEDPDVADADVLRVILTLQSLAGGSIPAHIVCEVRDVDNAPLVKLIGDGGRDSEDKSISGDESDDDDDSEGGSVEIVVSHDIVGRLMLMSARQPGIARVFNELLGFEGDEFYTEAWPEVYGKEFRELMQIFPDAIPIGIIDKAGKVILNPVKTHIYAPGERIIVIAEDDDTYEPRTPLEVTVTPGPVDEPQVQAPERILFCGWRRDIRDMMLLLDSMVAPGSELHMLCEKSSDVAHRTQLLLEDGLDIGLLQNLTLVHHRGNTAVNRTLLQLQAGIDENGHDTTPLRFDSFSVCMILADEKREHDMMHSDSHSLASLILIQQLQDASAKARRERILRSENAAEAVARWNTAQDRPCSIVCEILDSRTQETISKSRDVALKSDFVQSNKMISQILAMISEDASVNQILSQLLKEGGASIQVHPSHKYVHRNEEVSFMQLQARALRNDEILLGYQPHRGDNDETVINPKDKYTIKRWPHIDLIALAGHTAPEVDDTDTLKQVVQAFTSNVNQHDGDNQEPPLSFSSADAEGKSTRIDDENSPKRLLSTLVPPLFDPAAQLTTPAGQLVPETTKASISEQLQLMNSNIQRLAQEMERLWVAMETRLEQ